MARLGSGEGIVVDGLPELNKALKDFGDEFKGEMRKTNKEVADKVTAGARGAAAALGGVAAHVVPEITSSAGAQFAGVSLRAGGAAAGAEFGGRGRPRTQQFQPWRGSGPDAGYFLYPTIRRDLQNGRIESDYKQGLERLLRKTGLG